MADGELLNIGTTGPVEPHNPMLMWKTAPRNSASSYLCDAFNMLHMYSNAACPKFVPSNFFIIFHDVWQYVSLFTVRHNATMHEDSVSVGKTV